MSIQFSVRVVWMSGDVTYSHAADLDQALASYRTVCNLVGSPYMPEHKVASVSVSRSSDGIESFPYVTTYGDR